jgi:twitching motility protein PilT
VHSPTLLPEAGPAAPGALSDAPSSTPLPVSDSASDASSLSAAAAAPLTIIQLLHELVAREGSDLHLRADEPPVIRIHGTLTRLPLPRLSSEDTERLMYSLMNDERRRRFERELELDMSYAIEGLARFRVNCFRQRGCVGGVLRVIPTRVKTIDEMGLPPILKNLALLPRGLVLVTGPTGSGKSTTLASCIDHINNNRRCHIITIEDPIEFVHEDKTAAVEQRELGEDTRSFADALKHVMRQAPDVILVGEMRDLETIALAITAAETGHLVFATLHTTDAPQTIDRIIDVFPPEQQEQIRAQLAGTLQAGGLANAAAACRPARPRAGLRDHARHARHSGAGSRGQDAPGLLDDRDRLRDGHDLARSVPAVAAAKEDRFFGARAGQEFKSHLFAGARRPPGRDAARLPADGLRREEASPLPCRTTSTNCWPP